MIVVWLLGVNEAAVCTFYAQPDLLQAPVLENRLGHIAVLDVLEEAVQLGAVDDWGQHKRGTSLTHVTHQQTVDSCSYPVVLSVTTVNRLFQRFTMLLSFCARSLRG